MSTDTNHHTVGEGELHLAALQNDAETVERLISAGEDINIRDTEGCTALHVACSCRCVDVALFLLNARAAVDLLDNAGETALHKACREDQLRVVQALCAYRCPVDVVNKAGQSALHIAARVGNAECVRCLLLNGADTDLLNKDGLSAEDISQGQGHTEVTDLLARLSTSMSADRSDPYIKQLAGGMAGPGGRGVDSVDEPEINTVDQPPLTCIKLKMFGNCCVGKTTLVDSLRCGYIRALFRQLSRPKQGQGLAQGQKSVQDVEGGTGNHHEGCTRCIDIQHISISGAGDLSVWEFSGSSCYYVCYDHFVGDPNCIHCVVFRVSDPPDVQQQQIRFWLNFIRARIAPTEPIGFAGTQMLPARVLLIGTHADLAPVTSLRRNARGQAELVNNASLITSLQTSFGAELIIVPRVYVVDARQASGADMTALRSVIGDMKQYFCQYLPTSHGLLESTVAELPSWTHVLAGFPVVRWPTFAEYIRSRVNILATEYHLNELVCQLQLIGQVVYIETAADDLVVLNPRWLCGEVLGKLLGGLEHLPSDGRLSGTHLTGLFPDVDVADSTTLLTALELCTVVTPGSWYQLSCRNSLPAPEDNRKSDCPACVGGVALVAESTAQLRYVFPRVQHAIWNAPPVEQPSEWSGGIRFRRESSPDSITITVEISTEEGEDVMRVICRGDDPRTLHEQQQTIVAIVLRVIDTCCPGVYLQLRALSPRDIRAGDRPLPRAYAARELATAQLDGREEVRFEEEDEGETLKDVLAFGDEELYASLRPGVELHVSELPMFTRCRLGALLDPPHPQGRNWLLLALGLDLGDSIPQVDDAETASLCRTDHLLALWSHSQDATVRRLVDVVRRTLQRPDVEETLLRLTPLCQSSSVNPEKSVCPSTGTNLSLPAVSCNHSQQISRTPSAVSA